MTFRVVTTPEAEQRIRAVDSWWREHRTAAPDLFSEELAASFALLQSAAFVGRRYSATTVNNVRRILLRSTRFHVYYAIHDDAVIVLSVWSAVRGRGPDLTPTSS